MIFSSGHFIIIAFPQVFSSHTMSRSFVNLPLSINNPNNHNRSFHTKRIFYQLTDAGQARRQDLAAGGPQTRWRGHIFKILYWMYGATRGANVKWGAHISNGGGRAPLAPRWRRP